ncbi:MAG: hypothetical protein QOJ99_3334, partial [Bryobacterales bacterium]|nr:hypothetical protein [Bryobacterales bacterium]
SLDTTYPTLITGVLTLTSASSNFGTDPAVQFSSGGRQVSFAIPAGSLDAVFPSGSTQIRLQSGTAAGTITVTPGFSSGPNGAMDITPQNAKTLQLVIPPLAPVLLTASLGTRTFTSFSILVSGYSTNRFLDHLTVQFTPASGVSIGSGSATIDVSAAARIWFQSVASQNLGGQFSIELPFTLGNGSVGTDLTKSLSGVTITATNETGTSNAVKVSIP